jgi:tetratricopeptide (TPR) repeat protein
VFFAIQRASVLSAAPAPEFPFVDNPIAGAGFWSGRATAMTVMTKYLWLIVWPARLSSDYSYSQIPLATGGLVDWAASAAIVLLAAGCALLWRRDRIAAFWAGFAFLTFLPAANLLFPTGTIMAERVMYLPSLGIIAVLVTAAERLMAGVPRQWQSWGPPADGPRIRLKPDAATFVLAAVTCGIVAALSARTWTRNRDWRDDVSLWTSAAAASPFSFKAHRGLAEALYEQNPGHPPIDRVVSEIERATALLDALPDAQNDARTYRLAGVYLLEHGDVQPGSSDRSFTYGKAVTMLRRASAIIEAHAPNSAPAADAYRLLSAAYTRLHKNDEAIEAVARARLLDPLNVAGYRQGAAAYLAADRREDAAVALMTGSLVTNDRTLRDELIDLYRSGLDPLGCAIVSTPSGPAIDPSCATVRRHACAAARDAIQIHERSGRPDLAQRLKEGAARQFQCP